MTAPWHVLGVGAIGGLFAFRLHEGGAAVTLLDHHHHSHKDSSGEITLTFTGDVTGNRTFSRQSVSATQPITHLLVCTKSWAVRSAVTSVAHRLSAESIVVILCNGMGHADAVAPHLNGASLVLGSTTAGCRLMDAGARRVSGKGASVLGAIRPLHVADDWLSPWQKGVPAFHWSKDIHSVLLAKVALNAVINPLTGMHRITNGDLLNAEFLDLTEQVTQEVQRLLMAAGAFDLAEALPEQVRAVCHATAQNHSSMRVDMDRGQRTEIESIVGWLLHHMTVDPPETPVLSALYASIVEADNRLETRP